jgi:2-oxoglutarate ferredoxin oxidoreductase subunit alpha
MPKAVRTDAAAPTKLGVIYYGSTSPAIPEALELIAEQTGASLNQLRLRAFPFGPEVDEFVDAHDTIFVVEQNRDAQMRSLLTLETQVEKSKLRSLLHYSGLPVSSQFIVNGVLSEVGEVREGRVAAGGTPP